MLIFLDIAVEPCETSDDVDNEGCAVVGQLLVARLFRDPMSSFQPPTTALSQPDVTPAPI